MAATFIHITLLSQKPFGRAPSPHSFGKYSLQRGGQTINGCRGCNCTIVPNWTATRGLLSIIALFHTSEHTYPCAHLHYTDRKQNVQHHTKTHALRHARPNTNDLWCTLLHREASLLKIPCATNPTAFHNEAKYAGHVTVNTCRSRSHV